MFNQIPSCKSKWLLAGLVVSQLLSCTAGHSTNLTPLPPPFKVQAADKVDICHLPPGNPENAQTISIAASTLATHLAHGDKEGECPSTASTATLTPAATAPPATPSPPPASTAPPATPSPSTAPVAKPTVPRIKVPVSLAPPKVLLPSRSRMHPPSIQRMIRPIMPMHSMKPAAYVRVNVLFIGDVPGFEADSCHQDHRQRPVPDKHHHEHPGHNHP